jgi:hypothetical protein
MDKKLLSQTIYLETDEEITSIIDRLRESEANEIILVIPKGSELFKSVVNLKLIKKQTDKFKKQISIVTIDKAGLNLAKQAGFSVSDQIKKDGEKHIDFTENEGVNKKSDIKNNSDKKIAQDEIYASSPQPLKRIIEPTASSFIKNTAIKNKILGLSNSKNNRLNKFSDIIRKDKKQNEVLKIKRIKENNIKNEARANELFARKEIPKIEMPEVKKKKKTVVLLPSLSAKFFLVFLAFCAIVTLGAAFLILPSADIAITPKTEPLTINLDVIIDKNISETNLETSKIPGQIISVEKEASQEFPATGIKKMEEKAKGIVTIYNEWDSSSQILVKTTRFLSKEGKLFRTIKTVTVPGFSRINGDDIPGTIDVEVIADEPGEDFNIDSTSFTIPGLSGTTKYSSIYGRSKEPMAGGIVGEVKIVSEKDIEEAKNFLAVIFQEKAKNQLKEETPDGLETMENSSHEEIVESNSSAAAGDQADKFTQFVKVKSSVLAFGEEDLKDFAAKNLIKNAAEEREIIGGAMEISYGKAEIDFEAGQMIIPVHIEALAAWKINEDEIKNQILGKNEGEIRNYLQDKNEIKRAKVSFWPFWVKRVPRSANKINLTIDSIEN